MHLAKQKQVHRYKKNKLWLPVGRGYQVGKGTLGVWD